MKKSLNESNICPIINDKITIAIPENNEILSANFFTVCKLYSLYDIRNAKINKKPGKNPIKKTLGLRENFI